MATSKVFLQQDKEEKLKMLSVSCMPIKNRFLTSYLIVLFRQARKFIFIAHRHFYEETCHYAAIDKRSFKNMKWSGPNINLETYLCFIAVVACK